MLILSSLKQISDEVKAIFLQSKIQTIGTKRLRTSHVDKTSFIFLNIFGLISNIEKDLEKLLYLNSEQSISSNTSNKLFISKNLFQIKNFLFDILKIEAQ